MLRSDTGQEIANFPFGSYKLNEMNEVKDWNADPTFSQAGAVVSDHKALLRWSYPGILYVDLRCAWVHNFVPDNPDIIINDADFLGRGEPYYRFVSPSRRFLFMLPLPFLLASLDRAIRSFEAEANTRNILPLQ